MDAIQIGRILENLVASVVEADARHRERGNDREFRELLRLARANHGQLLDALREHRHLSTERLRRMVVATDTIIDQLEALARLPEGKGG